MKAIDLFAGFGGFTLGAEQAGVSVEWAANHWPLAVEAHALNHPNTQHACQDLRQADWTKLPSYDLLLASPACQGHSQASQPKRRLFHDALRATAWAVVDCAEVTTPKAVIVENVVDFKRWQLYPIWRRALEALGYHLQEIELLASRLGVPQRRKRLFIIATRNAAKVIIKPDAKEAAFAPCIDMSAGRWREVSEAPARVQERIARGRRNHGFAFLSQHVTNHPGVPLHEPIRTITTKDQWCFVRGNQYRSLTVREIARGMGFPDHYAWPKGSSRSDAIKGLGNAVPPPVASRLITEVAGAL
jgi:DNA (cytosine-5)-methyltransferase 1